jgi:hypothetical protein
MEQRKKPEQMQKGGEFKIWHKWTPRRETIAYRMWRKKKGVIPPGTQYIVRRIFVPRQYPSWTLIWYDPDLDVDVRANVSGDLWKVMFFDWRPSKVIYYIAQDQYTDGFLVREEPGKRYRKDETGYVLEEDQSTEAEEWDGGF